MMMGAEEKEKLKQLKEYAESHRIPMRDAKLMQERKLPQPGDDPHYVVKIPLDFRVVYSIEHHPEGWLRHLTVSVSRPGNYAHPFCVDKIMRELGFEGKMTQPTSKVTSRAHPGPPGYIEILETIDALPQQQVA